MSTHGIHLAIVGLFLSFVCHGQLIGRKINQYDEDGNRNGKWVEYWDGTHTAISGKGKYKNGKLVGKWKYYHINGKRRLRFKYKDERIKVAYFDQFGQIERKGWARMVNDEQGIRYFWEGWWKEYDKRRRVIKKIRYENGEMIDV